MVTQNDIAKKLGISRTTVARALSGRSVSEETRQLVCEEAKRAGYVHNSAATGLATKNSKKVYAFIIATIDVGYGKQMKEGIDEVARIWQGYRFEIEVVFTDITQKGDHRETQMQQFYQILESENVDGVIFSALSSENMAAVSGICKERGIPLMTLDLIYRDSTLCHVGPDYFKLGTYSAAYMASLMRYQGCILTMTFDEGYELAVQRMEGFHNRLQEFPEIHCHSVTLEEHTREYYFEALEKALEKCSPIAIYAPYHMDYVGDFLKERGLAGCISLISNGVNEQVEDYLFDGTITGIVSAKPYFLGAVAANNFFKMFFRPAEMHRGEIDVSCDIYIKDTYKRFDRIY